MPVNTALSKNKNVTKIAFPIIRHSPFCVVKLVSAMGNFEYSGSYEPILHDIETRFDRLNVHYYATVIRYMKPYNRSTNAFKHYEFLYWNHNYRIMVKMPPSYRNAFQLSYSSKRYPKQFVLVETGFVHYPELDIVPHVRFTFRRLPSNWIGDFETLSVTNKTQPKFHKRSSKIKFINTANIDMF